MGLELHVQSKDKAFGQRLGKWIAHCLWVEIVVVIAGNDEQVACLCRERGGANAHLREPNLGQLVAQAQALQAAVAVVTHPSVEHTVKIELGITNVFGCACAVGHQRGESAIGVSRTPSLQNVAVGVQSAVVVGGRISGLYAHFHPKIEDEVDAQLPVFLIEGVDKTARNFRVGGAHILVLGTLLLGS